MPILALYLCLDGILFWHWITDYQDYFNNHTKAKIPSKKALLYLTLYCTTIGMINQQEKHKQDVLPDQKLLPFPICSFREDAD